MKIDSIRSKSRSIMVTWLDLVDNFVIVLPKDQGRHQKTVLIVFLPGKQE